MCLTFSSNVNWAASFSTLSEKALSDILNCAASFSTLSKMAIRPSTVEVFSDETETPR